ETMEKMADVQNFNWRQAMRNDERSCGAKKRTAKIIFVGLTSVFLISLFYHAPAGDYFTICTFRNFTGLPCPGCGLTHSFCSFAKGHLVDALRFNAIGPPLFVVMVFVWIRNALILLNRASAASAMDSVWKRFRLTAVFATGFAVYGIGRIVYILLYSPGSMYHSPLHHLLGIR
ncbi:MAG: DUF2752 domain-containing protein, partial [Blastocatellia bacterium]